MFGTPFPRACARGQSMQLGLMRIALSLFMLALPALAASQQTGDPRDGRAVLERMHTAYAGKWYATLAFVQRTLHPKPDGGQDTSTWYESFKGANQMRIDFGDP